MGRISAFGRCNREVAGLQLWGAFDHADLLGRMIQRVSARWRGHSESASQRRPVEPLLPSELNRMLDHAQLELEIGIPVGGCGHVGF